MDSLLLLAFLALFDLLLLVVLFHFYKRLGYRFLAYGSLALAVGGLVQLLEYSPLLWDLPVWHLLLPGLAGMVYLGLLATSTADLTGRHFPWRLYVTMLVTFVAMGTVSLALPLPYRAVSGGLEVPAGVLLLVIASMLIRYRHPQSAGEPALAAIVLIHLVVGGALSLLGEANPYRAPVEFMDNVILLMVGIALLMITAERAIGTLENREERLEAFKEERRRLELQFSHAQKLESLGVLAGGIAHDFNNMLTSILGYASLAMKKLPNDSEIRKDLYMVMSGARQAVDLTSQMLIYAGKGALEFEATDISRVADNLSSLIHSIIPRKIQLVQKLARDLPALKGDRVQLGQVLMNLVANAVDAIEDNTGTIEITTGLVDVDRELLRMSYFSEEREPGAYLYMRVRDTGIGMDETQVERIFDPFYSEKQTNKGLGLSSLSGIVRQHNGFIRVKSRPGEGSEFTAYFPVLAYQEAGDDGRFRVRPSEKLKGSILLADDDPRIRSLMASILEGGYFRLTSAEDGREALRTFEENPPAFDLLVLDCTMPKLSGPEVYKKIRAGGSSIPVVLVSGYHQDQVLANISNDPRARFIKKPFNVDDFLETVLDALKSASITDYSQR